MPRESDGFSLPNKAESSKHPREVGERRVHRDMILFIFIYVDYIAFALICSRYTMQFKDVQRFSFVQKDDCGSQTIMSTNPNSI